MIRTGEFIAPNRKLVGYCYSGQPPFVNDPTKVAIKDRGPLPPGPYRMESPINTDPDRSEWGAHAHLGPFVIPLTPEPMPEYPNPRGWLYGRSGFYIHGDSIAKPGYASDGCIVPTKLPDGRINGHAVRVLIAEIQAEDAILIVETGNTPATEVLIT